MYDRENVQDYHINDVIEGKGESLPQHFRKYIKDSLKEFVVEWVQEDERALLTLLKLADKDAYLRFYLNNIKEDLIIDWRNMYDEEY